MNLRSFDFMQRLQHRLLISFLTSSQSLLLVIPAATAAVHHHVLHSHTGYSYTPFDTTTRDSPMAILFQYIKKILIFQLSNTPSRPILFLGVRTRDSQVFVPDNTF